MRELRLPAAAIRQRVAEWIASPPPDRFLLIEPDPDARDILLTEIRRLTDWPASAVSVEEASQPDALLSAVPLCRIGLEKIVLSVLPAGIELVSLQFRSANKWLGPELPSIAGKLVGVVSAWDDFRESAKTMLAAAGIDPDLLLMRNPHRPRWQRGLDQTGAIICDAHTARLREITEGAEGLRLSSPGRHGAVELSHSPESP